MMMEHKIVTMPAFTAAGIKIRTSNASAMIDIPAHWQHFFDGGYMKKIPNRVDEEILAMYTEYEGDHTKPYSLIIGCRISSTEGMPPDVVVHSIPEAKYAVFHPTGKMPDIVVETWQHVWQSDLKRAFTTDFEACGPTASDPVCAELDIYIAIKE